MGRPTGDSVVPTLASHCSTDILGYAYGITRILWTNSMRVYEQLNFNQDRTLLSEMLKDVIFVVREWTELLYATVLRQPNATIIL